MRGGERGLGFWRSGQGTHPLPMASVSVLSLGLLLLSLSLSTSYPTLSSQSNSNRPTVSRTALNSLSTKLTTMTIIGALTFWTGFGSTQFDTANDIPANYFQEKKTIRAVVERVVDGDTARVRHIANSQSRNYKGALKDHTITVRFAAVDTPETAKKGQPGQPFAEEAKTFTESKIQGKEINVKLLSKDQYGRVIGRIKYKESYMFGLLKSEKDISEELLKKGLAVVYRQGGAQYDGDRDKWNALENTAVQKRKGIWMNGKEKADLPSDYKKNYVKEKANVL
jgi:micrococcal nuclease